MKLRLVLLLNIFFLVVIFLPKRAFAEDFKADYTTQYIPKQNGLTDVKIHVKITNLRADLFVREFSLTFPPDSDMTNVQVTTDHPQNPAEIKQSQSATIIKTSFAEPDIVKNAQNDLYITFTQKNIFFNRGESWEVTIPALSQLSSSNYNIELFLPNASKTLSISKPNPTTISKEKIVWNNVKAPTIYAVFGNSQSYKLALTYHLKNDSFSRGRFDIALPPETLYQQIYVDSLKPEPQETFIDEDGNFMASYILSPRGSLSVTFNGYATVLAKPQESMLPYIQNTINLQKPYLLNAKKYWEISSVKPVIDKKGISTIADIFTFILHTLTYDRGRISKDIVRFGAAKALSQPSNAVCMEYTDLFVAAARSKDFFAREIEGYGYSQDEKLRPQSFLSDVLHSWGEYYDTERRLWVPVDPTWQDTSGIDYFNGFDLNHIVFAIHGKDSMYPLAAGMYKLADTRDISVEPVSTKPPDAIRPIIMWDVKKSIFDGKDYEGTLALKNDSPVFIKNVLLKIDSQIVKFMPSSQRVDLLAPGETRQIKFHYQAPRFQNGRSDRVVVSLDQMPLLNQSIAIISFEKSLSQTVVGIAIGLICLIGIIVVIRPKFFRHDH